MYVLLSLSSVKCQVSSVKFQVSRVKVQVSLSKAKCNCHCHLYCHCFTDTVNVAFVFGATVSVSVAVIFAVLQETPWSAGSWLNQYMYSTVLKSFWLKVGNGIMQNLLRPLSYLLAPLSALRKDAPKSPDFQDVSLPSWMIPYWNPQGLGTTMASIKSTLDPFKHSPLKLPKFAHINHLFFLDFSLQSLLLRFWKY